MKKLLIRIAIVLVVLVIAGLVVFWLNLNTIVKRSVETVGPYLTKTEVKLDSASVSPFSGSGSLKGLFVGNPEGYKTPSAIKLGSFSVEVSLPSLKSDKIVIKSLEIDSAEVTLEGGLKDNNLTKIMANLEEATGGSKTAPKDEKTEKAQKTASQKIQVDDLVIRNAKVNFNLSMLAGAATPVTIPEIHLKNVGGSDGTTVADLSKLVFKEILGNVDTVATEVVNKASKIATDAAKNMGNEAKSGVEKATKSIGNIFKK
jgi:uncharacterized protein involved in outer membrane biogenesis